MQFISEVHYVKTKSRYVISIENAFHESSLNEKPLKMTLIAHS